VVFGPHLRSYAYKVPKKVRKLALKMALSSKVRDNEMIVLDRLELERIKTKDFVSIIKSLETDNVLLVTDQKDDNLEMSSRNVPNVKVLRSEGLNVYDLLKYKNVILLEPAVKALEGRLSA